MLLPTRVESAVDYLTAVSHYQKSSSIMLSRAERLAHLEERRGNIVKGWGMAGFEGIKVGQLQWGSRGHEGIVRLSGELAAWEWFEFYQDADRITRIDVQETFRMGQPVTPFIQTQWKAIRRYAAEHKRNLTLRIIVGNDEGCTLYIGSRKSETMTRVYNKHVESGLERYRQCCRYEGEFKGARASQVAHRLASGNELQESVHIVLSEIMFNYAGLFPTTIKNRPPILMGSSPRSSDALKASRFLATSARKSVRLVLAHLGPCALKEALALTNEDVRAMLTCNSTDTNPIDGGTC